MKKKITLFLCLVMVFAMAVPSMAAFSVNTDVDHYRYMNVYKENGETYVKPDQPITRAELANVIYNLLNSNIKNVAVVSPIQYTDLTSDNEYYKQITFLSYKGYMQGYPDGTFQPDGLLTRAEFAEVIVRSQRLARNENALRAPDIDGHWAKGAINAMMGKDYMTGYPDGEFKPENTITRAEVAATMNRIYNRELDTTTVINNMRLIDAITNQIVTPYLFNQIFPDLPKEHWAYDDMMEACVSHRIYWDNVGAREIWIKELIE